MPTLIEIEKNAMSLSKPERGILASRLIASLGSPFDESDEDVIELALRRDQEMDENPDSAMTEEEFWDSIKEYRRG